MRSSNEINSISRLTFGFYKYSIENFPVVSMISIVNSLLQAYCPTDITKGHYYQKPQATTE